MKFADDLRSKAILKPKNGGSNSCNCNTHASTHSAVVAAPAAGSRVRHTKN